ncbi:hypothetical protein GCM10022198_00510 [Klugiella xanthotipulae]|uniref:Uncharacterized protein n=1 Tax=Klugiella xanthotipulae TaxID=244735 RepID=A0A543I5S6_9MICO|nr:hypothetical protein FB466_0623 [Klugiella xanthotipulae]
MNQTLVIYQAASGSCIELGGKLLPMLSDSVLEICPIGHAMSVTVTLLITKVELREVSDNELSQISAELFR